MIKVVYEELILRTKNTYFWFYKYVYILPYLKFITLLNKLNLFLYTIAKIIIKDDMISWKKICILKYSKIEEYYFYKIL